MRRQSFVDPNNVVVLGHSWGGLGALGIAYDAPPGVVGIINFAGGGGSFAPGQICSGKDRLIADVGRLSAGDHIPEIWLYAENDDRFAPPLAHAMYDAYRAKARAPVTFVQPAAVRCRRPFHDHARRPRGLGAGSRQVSRRAAVEELNIVGRRRCRRHRTERCSSHKLENCLSGLCLSKILSSASATHLRSPVGGELLFPICPNCDGGIGTPGGLIRRLSEMTAVATLFSMGLRSRRILNR